MSRFDWYSQSVPKMGAITSEGIRNLLGAHKMDPLTVLVREAAQNSWDARLTDSTSPVRFDLELDEIVGSRLMQWRTRFSGSPGPPIAEALDGEAVDVLFVSDRGTTGLGGSTGADAAIGRGNDYASFVLNIGSPRDTDFGGGTYGFGKSIFYAVSNCGSIVVHTRHTDSTTGEIGSRLVGVALGDSYRRESINYTGRHWWGEPADDGIEPLTGDAADSIAAELGFPSFDAGETGTTIAVLAPELGDRSGREAADWLARAIGWHLWPKMMPNHSGDAEMEFSVISNGSEVVVPSPENDASLAAFAQSFERQRSKTESKSLTHGAAKKPLGAVGLYKTFEPPPVLDEVAVEAGLTGAVHHVALMRKANLVVRYEPGPNTADENVWYTGVFKPAEELDDVFALSEPPTHDDWIPERLTGEQRSKVNVALRKLSELLVKYTLPKDPGDARDGSQPPLGAASKYFASLLTAGSTGAGPSISSPPREPTKPRKVRLQGDPFWAVVDGRSRVVQTVLVDPTANDVVSPVVSVVIWGGGKETEAPSGRPVPTFLFWRKPDGSVISEPTIKFTSSDAGEWEIVVEPVPDAAVRIELSRDK